MKCLLVNCYKHEKSPSGLPRIHAGVVGALQATRFPMALLVRARAVGARRHGAALQRSLQGAESFTKHEQCDAFQTSLKMKEVNLIPLYF